MKNQLSDLVEGNKLVMFRGIGKLYSLAPAAAKGARRIYDADLGLVSDAAIIADRESGKIMFVGAENQIPENLRRSRESEVVDLGGRAVIPALVECHTHLVYAGSRAFEFEMRNRGETYQSIAAAGGGIQSTVSATRMTSEESHRVAAQARVDRLVRQGVATLEIKSGYGLNFEHETKMLRVARSLTGPRIVTTCLAAHAVPKEVSSAAEHVDYWVSEGFGKLKLEGLAERVDIFVESGYFNADLARRYLHTAQKLGFALTIHADQLTRSGGAELAIELGAQSADHLLQINKSDIVRLGSSEVTSVLLPTADLYLRCPYPPARELIEAGARVALATDHNPGTAPSLDVSLVGVLARATMKMTLAETLVAYTLGGAFALGLQDKVGSIELGKSCDFCVLESELSDLFFDVGRMPINSVYKEGRAI